MTVAGQVDQLREIRRAMLLTRRILARVARYIRAEDAHAKASQRDPLSTSRDAADQAAAHLLDFDPRDFTAINSLLSDALTELQHRREAEAAYVSVRTMKVSPRPDGSTADFFVSIKVGDREVTPHVFRERFKAEYHVAIYDWLLNGGDEPELMAFREDEWPARKLGPDLAASPSSPASGVRVKALEWSAPSGRYAYKSSFFTEWKADPDRDMRYVVRYVEHNPEAKPGYFVPPFEPYYSDGSTNTRHGSLVEVQAIHQADYDARILSAIGEHP